MFHLLLVLAQADTPPPAGPWDIVRSAWFIPVIFVIVMYLLIIAPQRKKDKKRAEIRKSLKKNDKIVTIGGIHGVVKSLTEDEVVILIDEGKDVKMKMSRQSVLTVKERPGQDGSEQ